MEIAIKPSLLKGIVEVPSAKNLSHYYILAAALSSDKIILEDISFPQDVLATLSAVQKLGAEIQVFFADRKVEIIGIGQRLQQAIRQKEDIFSSTVVNCQDSGNTLRLCMPIFLLGGGARFYGTDKLLERNRQFYADFWQAQGIDWQWEQSGIICRGFLQNGIYQISNQVNVAFVIGMIFALSLVQGNSIIELPDGITETAYLDLALRVCQEFGVSVKKGPDNSIEIAGSNDFAFTGNGDRVIHIEGDYAQAAVFLSANALGNDIEIKGLPLVEETLQPEKEMISLLQQCKKEGVWQVDVSQIPYLVPSLVAIAALRMGTTYFICDKTQTENYQRLLAMCYEINKMGADVQIGERGIQINGVPSLHGAQVTSTGDHRIAMALAIVATVCEEPLILKEAECVVKSYPDFWQQYVKLGGDISCLDA